MYSWHVIVEGENQYLLNISSAEPLEAVKRVSSLYRKKPGRIYHVGPVLWTDNLEVLRLYEQKYEVFKEINDGHIHRYGEIDFTRANNPECLMRGEETKTVLLKDLQDIRGYLQRTLDFINIHPKNIPRTHLADAISRLQTLMTSEDS